MNRKKIKIISTLIILATALTACGKWDGIDKKEKQKSDNVDIADKIEMIDEADVELPDNEIILIQRYFNHAYEYQDIGYFITSDGNIYSYDFSLGDTRRISLDNSESEGDLDYIEKLEMIKQYTDPIDVLDKKIVCTLYYYGMKIDENAEMSKEATACDAGEDYIIFRNPDTDNRIICSEDGDMSGSLKDENAEKIINLYEHYISQKLHTTDKNILYTASDIPIASYHCGYHDTDAYSVKYKYSEKYIIFDKEDFEANEFFSDFIDKMEAEDIDFDEEWVYFVEFENVSTMGYDLKVSSILRSNDQYRFILSTNSKIPAADESVGEALDGFLYVCAYPAAWFRDYTKENYKEKEYKDFNGNVWKKIKD